MNTPAESTFMEFILYNNWANAQLLQACQNLSEAQLEAVIPGAYGTIRGTLQHIIQGEEFYVLLLTGQRPQPPFNWDAKPSLVEMTSYAAEVGDALVEIAGRVRPTDEVVEEDNGQKFHYRAVVVFIQIINHGVEHRTNITTILNQGLQKPPGVDGWGYFESHLDRFRLSG